MTTRTIPRAAALLALVLAMPAQAHAQGAASRLGNPETGRPASQAAEPTPEPEPEPEVAEPDTAPEVGVTASPSYGRAHVPPPPGYGRTEGELEADVVNRLHALDATWASLATMGGPSVGSAVMSLVFAGISIGTGVLLLELGGSSFESMAGSLFVLAGTSVVRTVVVEFILRPNPSTVAIRYQNMPISPASAAVARMEFGETQLHALAEQAWIARMVDGSINIAGAVAAVSAYLVPKNFDIQPLEALYFIAPAFSLVSGIITLAQTTVLEQRWAAYEQMRSEQRARAEGDEEAALELPPPVAEPSLAFDIAVDPRGGGVGFVSGTF